MLTQRINYFDFLRGVAIIFVVMIHCFSGFLSHTETNGMWFDFNVGIRLVINCAVPIFLAISGYFMANKSLASKESYFIFERKQISKVYIPCLIWSLPYLFMNLLSGGSVGNNLINFAIGGYSVYYFIALIIQYYILLPLIHKYVERYELKAVIGSLIISMSTILMLMYITYGHNVELPLVIYTGSFPVWLVFFVVGVYFGRGYQINISNLGVWLLAVVCFVLSFCETRFLYNTFDGVIAVGVIRVSSIFFSLSLIILCFKMQPYFRTTLITNWLCQLGDLSFGIYLIHMFVLGYIVNFNMYWILKALCVVGISLSIVLVGRKVSPKYSKFFLGF